jgi:hypothetical protein
MLVLLIGDPFGNNDPNPKGHRPEPNMQTIRKNRESYSSVEPLV